MTTPMINQGDDLFKLTGAQPALRPETAPVPLTGISQRSIVTGNAVTPMTTVNNVPVGRAVGNLIMVWVAQLRLPEDPQRRGYNPDEDPMFDGLMESIRHTGGCNIDPLICEATDEMVEVDGEQRPVVIVRAGQRRYWALTRLGSPEALVRLLPRESSAQMVALVAFITNEMREPLTVLGRSDVVAMLIEDYGLRQHVIAAYTGLSQSTVSRLYMLSGQPPFIKTYISQEILGWADLETLNKRFKDDSDVRELAARYFVQEAGRVSVHDIANQIAPPPGMPVTARLALDGDTVQLIPIALESGQGAAGRTVTSTLASRSATPYWRLNRPLRAVPKRIIEKHHPVTLTGTTDEAQVAIKSLHITQLLDMVKKQGEIDIGALEEAMLCDLEAIREGMEKLPTPTNDEGEDE